MPDTAAMAVLGLLGAAWMAVSLWLVVRGLSMQRAAAYSGGQAARLSALVDASPAVPLLVRADWRVEGPGRIGQLLGIDEPLRGFDDLRGDGVGMSAEQHESLRKALLAAQRGGKPFMRTVRVQGSSRTLQIDGRPAPPALGAPGSVLLWLIDATEHEARQERLRFDRDEAVAAFEALSGLIEAAPFPMWFRDDRFALALVNRAYVTAAEAATADEVIAGRVELVEPVAGVSAVEAASAAQLAGEARHRIVPVTISGERRMMTVVDVPLGSVGVAGYAVDIQELEDVRAEYRRFAQVQRNMLDRLSAAVAQFSADRTLQFVNQPMRRLFAIDAAMADDHPTLSRVLDHLRDQGKAPEVRDFPEWKAHRAEWFTATEASEEEWLLRDGTHLRIVAQPMPDGGLVLIAEDRTEHVQLASTRDTLLRVRTATFDNLFEAVAVFAPDGRLHLWNQRFRKLWDADEKLLAEHPRVDVLMASLADRLLKPQQVSVMQEVVRTATRERQNRAGKVQFGDGRHFDFAAIPLPDGNALLIMLDVTDSRRMESALRERNDALEAGDKVKTAFLSRMSYELRTPLTSIGGFAEMLGGGYAGELPPRAQSYVTAILESVAVLGRQIDNVLDLAQGEAGTLVIDRTTLDVASLIAEAAARAAPLADAERVALVVEPGGDAGTIEGDPARLSQALDQLIDNAIRYTAESRRRGGRVLLLAEGDVTHARIIVSDNGPGLPDAVSAVADGRIGGTSRGGIGLALVRQLVLAHGGALDTISEQGQGTVIRVTLPRVGGPE